VLLACSGETRVDLLLPLSGGPDAGAPSSHLIHRYSFDGSDQTARDSINGADGSLLGGATLDGAGHAVLDGTDGYVNLPNGLISGLKDATVVVWLAWAGGPCWQRAFDFGSTDAGEDHAGMATSSLFMTPLRCPGTGPALSFETTSSVLGSVDSNTAFPKQSNASLSAVLDVSAGQMRLYATGQPLGTGTMASLTQLSDVNVWLGRSQWTQDVYLRGSYDEFRIYDAALGPDQLALVEAAGPDVVDQ
jgi:hypothetical protein